MTTARIVFKDFIYCLYFFVAFYGICVFIAEVVLRLENIYISFVMIVPFCIGVTLKYWVKNFFAFIASNIILFGLFLILPINYLLKINLCAFSIMLFLFFVIDKLDSTKKAQELNKKTVPAYFKREAVETDFDIRKLTFNHFISICGINCTILIISAIETAMTGKEAVVKTVGTERTYVVTAIIIFTLVIIHTHLSNLDNSLKKGSVHNIMPIKKLVMFNNGIIAGFALISAAILTVAVLFNVGNIFIYIGRGLLGFLRLLLSFFNTEDFELPENFFIEQTSTVAQGGLFMPKGNSFFIWTALEKMIFVVGPVLLVVLILYSVYTFFSNAYKKFYMVDDDGDIKESIKPDISVNNFNMFKLFSGLYPKWSADNRGKIRRIFYKKIVAHMKRGALIEDSSTPYEIAESLKNREDIHKLSKSYLKARYSDEEILDDEL